MTPRSSIVILNCAYLAYYALIAVGTVYIVVWRGASGWWVLLAIVLLYITPDYSISSGGKTGREPDK